MFVILHHHDTALVCDDWSFVGIYCCDRFQMQHSPLSPSFQVGGLERFPDQNQHLSLAVDLFQVAKVLAKLLLNPLVRCSHFMAILLNVRVTWFQSVEMNNLSLSSGSGVLYPIDSVPKPFDYL